MNRRELLGGLASGSALLLAFGCGSRSTGVRRAQAANADVRMRLREAVARLAVKFPTVHALAVTRRRTTGALDVLGMGVARTLREGVVLTVGDGSRWREQVTSDLSAAGIAAAVKALGAGDQKRPMTVAPRELGEPPAELADEELRVRLQQIAKLDKTADSRIIYAATVLDVDDATVWSLSPSHDREQRNIRIRSRVLRAAWNGSRPVISEAELAWIGGIDDRQFDERQVSEVGRTALQITTPGAFTDARYQVLLDPSVTATLVDAGVRALLTSTAAQRPEVAKRLAVGATLAAPLVSLVDDPTQPGAYGGFAFDDEGEVATPQTLVEKGRVAGVLGKGRGRRAGHVGALEPAPSHLRLQPGATSQEALRAEGLVLEGGVAATVDPSSSRVVLVVARARELKAGNPTGRVFADVELVGELRPILEAIDGVASETATTAYRDERDGEPTWRSIEAPWIRTAGLVRGRRRST